MACFWRAQVCTDMGVEAPISVSMKLGDIGNLFRRIVDAAQRPHLSIPETEAGKTNKNYHRLIQRSLTIAAGKLEVPYHLVKDRGLQSELHVFCS
jgi:Ras family protein T1